MSRIQLSGESFRPKSSVRREGTEVKVELTSSSSSPSVLNKTSPLRGFAIAARFGRLEDARESIRGLTHRKFQHPGATKFMVESGTWLEGYRDACLGDLALATLVYVPVSTSFLFLRPWTKERLRELPATDS